MAEYQIKFFKNLVSSDGHPFKVLQRVISVSHSQDCEDAVRIAQQRSKDSRTSATGDCTPISARPALTVKRPSNAA